MVHALKEGDGVHGTPRTAIGAMRAVRMGDKAALRKEHQVLWGAEPETLSAKVLKFESERNDQRF